MSKKYEIFAGVWQAHSHGVEEFDTLEQAEYRAYELAKEEYESYEGSHGILSYDKCVEDAQESWDCKDWTADDYYGFYLETIENTITYYVEEVKEDEC